MRVDITLADGAMSGRRPTRSGLPVLMKDVAAEVGLSMATISRALSNPDLVSLEKRELIAEAIERLQYRPNLMARNLRRPSTQLVLVIFPDLSPFFLEVFRGVERAAEELGYTALMAHSNRDLCREEAFLDQVASRRADGVLLVTTGDGALPNAGIRSMPPLVTILETAQKHQFPTVHIDDRAAAREATRHLTSLGHRRIAHVAGPMRMAIAQNRAAGFRDAVEEAGLNPKHCYVVEGDFSIAAGEAWAERLLSRYPRPTAIFAANDEMAIGVVQTLKRAGVAVGREMSVIGFDDQRIVQLYEPAITTIHVPTAELGYEAMMLLRLALEGENIAGRNIVLPTHLVERATTAPWHG